jgi:hypothetical protein
MLRAYKDHGHIFSTPTEDSDKPAVSA